MKTNKYILLALFSASLSVHALDMTTMTPVSCQEGGSDRKVTSLQTECGPAKICEMDVVCWYVDNDVLKNEFGGDVKKAADAAHNSITETIGPARVAVQLSKTIWSEASGKNPRFLNAGMNASCLTKESTCPSPLTCLVDKGVLDVKKEAAPLPILQNLQKEKDATGATK